MSFPKASRATLDNFDVPSHSLFDGDLREPKPKPRHKTPQRDSAVQSGSLRVPRVDIRRLSQQVSAAACLLAARASVLLQYHPAAASTTVFAAACSDQDTAAAIGRDCSSLLLTEPRASGRQQRDTFSEPQALSGLRISLQWLCTPISDVSGAPSVVPLPSHLQRDAQ